LNKTVEEKNLIHIREMTKKYVVNDRQIVILDRVDLNIQNEEMIAIMGPSGSGKSTLLFMLGLFLTPTSGSYFFGGQDILKLNRKEQAQFRRERIGFVFQEADMFEHSTVYENIEYPLIYAKTPVSERAEKIHRALDQVNLSHRIHHSSNKLSGGERQRVAIARAMVNSPEVILADEPTGQLDADNSYQVMDYFNSIAKKTDTAMIIVTHDCNVARMCHRTFQIENGRLQLQDTI